MISDFDLNAVDKSCTAYLQENKPIGIDWNLAGEILEKENPKIAWAGIKEDWIMTKAIIWVDGKRVSCGKEGFFSTLYGTPVLFLDGKFIKCSQEVYGEYSSLEKWNKQ